MCWLLSLRISRFAARATLSAARTPSGRSLATNLHRLRASDKISERVLRHSDVVITQGAFIKTVDADATRAMRLIGQQSPVAFIECRTLGPPSDDVPALPKPQIVLASVVASHGGVAQVVRATVS